MRELFSTNDPVLLSWAISYLRDAGLNPVVFDRNASILEGSIGALPRRVMVPADEVDRARRLLDEAEIEYVK